MDWSSLDRDLLGEISARIPIIEDFMSFRGVCTSWRSAAKKGKLKPSLPLSMMNADEERELYSLEKKKISMKISLPEEKYRRCIGAGFGWLLFDSGIQVHLLNPFTRSRIELPESLGRFGGYVSRAVLSADPSRTPTFIIVVIAGRKKGLGFWKPGQNTWSEIEVTNQGAFYDIIFYKDRFYGISDNISCSLVVWNPSEADLPNNKAEQLVEFDLPDNKAGFMVDMYLVESSAGELLLISLHGFWGSTGIGALGFDLTSQVFNEITSLGNDSIFLGKNASISVAAQAFPGVIKPNCIYFLDDGLWRWFSKEGPEDGLSFGVYSLEDGSIESLLDIVDDEFPGVWIQPHF